MNMTKILGSLLIIGLVALLASIPAAHAADDFLVIQRNSISLNDGSTSRRILPFTLPSNTKTSTATADSAVLQFMVNHANFTHDEIYLNPPTTACTDDGAEDANGLFHGPSVLQSGFTSAFRGEAKYLLARTLPL